MGPIRIVSLLPAPRWALLSLALVLACGEPAQSPPRFASPVPEGEVAARVLEALSHPDSLERTAAVAGLLATLGPDAIPQVTEAYEYQRPVLGDSEWMLLADWWTRHDPKGAYAWAISDRDHKTPGVLRYVIAGMARTDPETALVSLVTLRSKEQQSAAMDGIVRSWYLADPEALIAHLIDMKPGRDRQHALSILMALKVRREGMDAAIRWAEGLDEELPDRFKLQAYRRLVTELALRDPDTAKAFAEKHAAASDGTNLHRRVTSILSRTDPEGTLVWLGQMPAGFDRDQAVERAYETWVALDPDAARAWMASLPRERWTEPAREVHAASFARVDPEKALELASVLADPVRKEYVQARVVTAWLGRDESAARAWLEASDLSAELQRKIHDRRAQAQERARKMAMRRERQRLRTQQPAEPAP